MTREASITIAERILQCRQARGWSRRELSERTGISPRALAYYESSQVQPSAENLEAMSAAFGRCVMCGVESKG